MTLEASPGAVPARPSRTLWIVGGALGLVSLAAAGTIAIRSAVPAPVGAAEPAATGTTAATPVPPVPKTVAKTAADRHVAAAQPQAKAPVCADCGVVESVRSVTKKGQGTGLGAVAGGILGGVLGHQVGSGRGNDAATVIGAVGGAVAGHQIEKAKRKAVHYEVTVRLNDGSRHTVTSKEAPPWREGDQVKLVDGALYPAG